MERSGPGETEVKMLRVIAAADERQPIDIVANYCGAHSVMRDETTVQCLG